MPGRADLAADQRQRNQAARVVGAVHVLRDAHAPEDDCGTCARVAARDGAQRIRRNAADRRHLLRREILDVLGKGFEVLGLRLDILPVVQPFLDDRVEDAVEHARRRRRA